MKNNNKKIVGFGLSIAALLAIVFVLMPIAKDAFKPSVTQAQASEVNKISITCKNPDLEKELEGHVEDRLNSDLIVVAGRDNKKYHLSGDCVVIEDKGWY